MSVVECQEQLKKETMEKRLNKRKHTLQSKLMKKRLHPAYETGRQEIENPEEQEVQQEDGEQKGKLDLTRNHKRAKRTSKKRCWFCKSSGHYKRTCPSIK